MNYGAFPPSPPPEAVPERICASGVSWCSGISMCAECFHLSRDAVAPKVVVAGTNNGAVAKLYELAVALSRRGMDPSRDFGVHIDWAAFDPRRQAQAALVAYEQGYRELHARLAADPAFMARARGLAQAAQLPSPPPWQSGPPWMSLGSYADPQAAQGQAPMPPGYGQAPAAAMPFGSPFGPSPFGPPGSFSFGPSQAEPPMAAPAPEQIPTTGGGFTPLEEVPLWAAPAPPPQAQAQVPVERLAPRAQVAPARPDHELERAKGATRPLDAEEIALAGTTVDESAPSPAPSERTVNGAG